MYDNHLICAVRRAGVHAFPIAAVAEGVVATHVAVLRCGPRTPAQTRLMAARAVV